MDELLQTVKEAKEKAPSQNEPDLNRSEPSSDQSTLEKLDSLSEEKKMIQDIIQNSPVRISVYPNWVKDGGTLPF